MTIKYYIWQDGQVKTSTNWDEVLSCPGAYVIDRGPFGTTFGFVLPSFQWISISPRDVPKAFKLGLMLLEVYI